MKRLLALFAFILSISIVNAQETYRFRTDAPQGLSVTSSTATHLLLHYSIQELGIANIENDEVRGQEIILKGQFAPNAEGHPNLPVVNRYVAIPRGATVSLQVKENASTVLTDIDLLPAMPARTDLAEGDNQLRWDTEIFGKDAHFPTENIVLSAPKQIRSLDVVLLSVTPFRYNPVRKTLEVIYDIDIDLCFEGGNGQFGESRYFNPDWTHILRNLVINKDMIPSVDYYSLVKEARDRDEDGWEYLIIAPDDDSILAWADTLKAFRTKQGISTKVTTISECGGNSRYNISNYIRNAYNNWAIPPAAVLIFAGYYGTNISIEPCFETTIPDPPHQAQPYPTDYPYCDMNHDSLADITISRVTARDLDEYRIFVEKTIRYESNPPTDAAYYDRPIISSGHEENKWFMISSQSIDGFYRDKLGKRPTDLYMVNSGSIPDSIWSTGFNTSVLMDYFGPNGQNYIPQSIGELHDWRDKNDPTPLKNALNEGSFLTLYRGHSNMDSWWCPTFTSHHINTELYGPPTFVLSISCSTLLFNNWTRCLIDVFCLKENSGAVGGIGSSSLTHSYFNDILAWGIYDCIWPDFLPDMGSDTPPEFVRPSYVLSEAKHYFAYHVFLPNWWPDVDFSTMNLFGYTGETYLNLFTEVPQPIQIEHEPYCTADVNEYMVTAEEGAIVCLSRDGMIIGVNRSNGQSHAFTMPHLEEGDQFTITATKQNHFRYEFEVPVIPNGGPQGVIRRDEDENRIKTTSVFTLYPNPTDSNVNIIFDQDLHGKSVVEVYNVLGTRMTEKTFQNLAKGQIIAIDLQHFAPGIYTIKLCNYEGCWIQKASVK
jgi:hypothetical protein